MNMSMESMIAGLTFEGGLPWTKGMDRCRHKLLNWSSPTCGPIWEVGFWFLWVKDTMNLASTP